MANIYVASSWRNPYQPVVVERLRADGHDVYDFKNPEPGNTGFRWSDVDPDWKNWTPQNYRALLSHPIAEKGFTLDMEALERCDACLLVQPCGTSAHLELGWAVGAKKLSAVLYPYGIEPRLEDDLGAPGREPRLLGPIEPELMPKMCGALLLDDHELGLWSKMLQAGLFEKLGQAK